MVLRVLAVAFGVSLVVIALGSAIKTVVLPRASVSFVTRWVFLNVQHVFRVLARPSLSLAKRDRRLAWYSPLGLIATLVAWLTLTLVGFMFVFWGVEHVSMRSAFVESGSALLTLGLTRPGSLPGATIAFIAAGIGLFLLALLITYLPSIYAAFSRRELGVTALEIRAGSPPSGQTLIWRFWALQRMEHLNGVWVEWERWFVDIEETHTSLPAVVFFRSPQADHHWVTAAGAVLDGAALAVSTVDIERDVQAEFCLRAGYLCLRRIADFYNFAHDAEPSAGRPHLDHAVGVGRGGRDPGGGGRAAEGRPGSGVARLLGLAGELRRRAAGAREPHERTTGPVVLGPLRRPSSQTEDVRRRGGAPQGRSVLRAQAPGLNTMSRMTSSSTT